VIQIWCNCKWLLNHTIDLVTKTPLIFKGKYHVRRLKELVLWEHYTLQNPDTMLALQWSYLSYSCILTELRPLAFMSPERSFDWILSNFSRYLLTSFVSFQISSWYSFFWLFQERYTASSRVSPIISFVEVAYDCLLLVFQWSQWSLSLLFSML
jgi:hypothetical protein